MEKASTKETLKIISSQAVKDHWQTKNSAFIWFLSMFDGWAYTHKLVNNHAKPRRVTMKGKIGYPPVKIKEEAL